MAIYAPPSGPFLSQGSLGFLLFRHWFLRPRLFGWTRVRFSDVSDQSKRLRRGTENDFDHRSSKKKKRNLPALTSGEHVAEGGSMGPNQPGPLAAGRRSVSQPSCKQWAPGCSQRPLRVHSGGIPTGEAATGSPKLLWSGRVRERWLPTTPGPSEVYTTCMFAPPSPHRCFPGATDLSVACRFFAGLLRE